jgi:hypothetical protein
MTRFTLDPNAASGSLKGQPKVTARFKAEAPDSVCLSVVTEGRRCPASQGDLKR